MSNFDTAAKGINATIELIEQRGGKSVRRYKEGNKTFISFVGVHGKEVTVTVRTKTYGDWQTSTTYGTPQKENPNESNYWVFVDIGVKPYRFYPVPLWWIANNIHERYQAYLKKFGGHRKYNDDSTHHKVTLERIRRWEGQWDEMGL